MFSLWSYLLQSLRRLNSGLSQICKPNPKYTSGQIEQEFVTKKNKIILLIHVMICLIYTSQVFTNDASPFAALEKALFPALIGVLLLLSCRFHPQIFYVPYTALILIYGIMSTNKQDVIIAYAIGPAVPILQYILIGRIEHFVIQAMVQLFYLNVTYRPSMEEAVADMSPEKVIQAYRYSSSFILIVNCIVIVPMQYFKLQYHKHIWLESKRNELETQKTFLLSFSHELRSLINSLTGNVKLASIEEHIPNRIKELLRNAEVCGGTSSASGKQYPRYRKGTGWRA